MEYQLDVECEVCFDRLTTESNRPALEISTIACEAAVSMKIPENVKKESF
jgi:hypothetical protein